MTSGRGFIVALIGIVVAFCGARHLTDVDTVDGGTAWETQLVKAFSFDGLQYPDQVAPPPPPRPRGWPIPAKRWTAGPDKRPHVRAANLESPRGYRREDALSHLSKINSGRMARPDQSSEVRRQCPLQ